MMSSAEMELARGWQLQQAGQLPEAEKIYRQVLSADPANANAWCYLGMVCHDQSRYDEAIGAYDRALKIQPKFPVAFNNLGNSFRMQRRLHEALASFDEALRQKPDYVNAHKNKGTTLLWEGFIPQALECFQRALQLAPDDAETHKNVAVIWLLQGRFDVGWPEYEWRLQATQGLTQAHTEPRWDGSSLDGRTILLAAEQGLGDTLQFIRYGAALKQKYDVRVIAEVPRLLLPLLAGFEGIDLLVAQGDPTPNCDCWAPMLSVPGLMGHFQPADFPSQVPYLRTAEHLDQRWSEELRKYPGVKVGIAWKGSPKYQADHMRSIPLEALAPLGEIDGLHLISLQRGIGTEQIDTVAGRLEVISFMDQMDTNGAFLDTAAVLKQLDVLITADTAIAHLAGALGVRTWLGLSYIPDWRWQLERTESEWYPSIRLFRQPRSGAWPEVAEAMTSELLQQFPQLRVRTPSERRLATTGRNRLARTRDGLLLYNRHDVYIGKSLDMYGEFSHSEVEIFRQMVRPGSIVVEAGANIGAHTVPLARWMGNSGGVYAFEPQRLIFQMLCANVALNSLSNVICRCEGLAEQPGSLVVSPLDYDRTNNFGGVSLSASRAGGERVPVTTIDSLQLARCQLIKADVEGMELSVLRGAAETIRRCQPLLYVENDRREKSPALIEWLLGQGYRLYWHVPYLYRGDNYFRNPHNEFNRLVSVNLLGIPSKVPINVQGLMPVEDPQSWYRKT